MTDPKQLKCPSCGAALSLSIPNQIVVECPYCHQQVVNPNAYKSTKEGKDARILEFKLELKDVVKKLIDCLVIDKNVPRDIFEKMKISSTKQYYIPMYNFEGTYRAPWSATIERHERRQRIGYNGKLEDYYETLYDYQNGEAAGNFSFNCVPNEVLERLHIRHLNYGSINLSPTLLSVLSQVSNLEGIDFVESSEDADSVWRESGEGYAQNIGIDNARYQARGNMANYSVSCELKKSWMVYIPIWIIRYEYKGESYLFAYSAEQQITLSRPFFEHHNEDDNIIAQPTEEQKAILDKYNKRDGVFSDVRNFGCLSTALIGPIGCGVIEKFDLYGFYSGHYADNFNMYFFFIGLGLVIIMNIIRYFYRLKSGINNIENDIANRTKILQANAKNRREKELREAEQYRRETGHIFLKTFGSIVGNNSDEIKREKEENYQKKTETDFYESVQPRAKICIKCGKEINSNHLFCRYCGTKQE